MNKPDIDFKKVKKAVAEKKDNAIAVTKEATEQIAAHAEKVRTDLSIKQNKPITIESLGDEYASLPNLLQIVDSDARTNKIGCATAIGFDENIKDSPVYTFLTQYADQIGVTYYPSARDGVYYVDPINPNRYIDIDDYFDYLRKERVNELVEVARDLGAEYVRVKLLEEKVSITGKKRKEQAKVKNAVGSAGAEEKSDEESKEITRSEILKENNFPGGLPKKPSLKYFHNESEIQHLINLRMDKKNPAKGKQTLIFKASSSFGIKSTEAIKIDGALKKIGISADATGTMTEMTNRENRLYYEYEIRFPE